ncbi:MAG TPA: PQQ-dependent sugar dehydrogenase [Pyrinomonadaceae bacterium]|jgi:glucose/arabinose dehydrogenase|nr:PQQ-dependent sugar dehydrogenase [Pyrinomonadaceae bacterium]
MTKHGSLSLEVLFDGLSFPTSLALGEDGSFYVAESGLPFDGAAPGGRIWHLEPGGRRTVLVENLRAPVNGLTLHKDRLYVSEGGHPGRISHFDLSGHSRRVILDNLPGPGNYHANMVAFGSDGKLYFSQGAMTNTGIIGLDAYDLGWLRRLPHSHDLPGYDITLNGVNVETLDPLSSVENARTETGAFAPFGQRTEPGQRVAAQLPCTAAIMRCDEDGNELELVAWGLRNAYGLGFLPDGRLLATDQGADDRGSRPVGNVPDMLFEVRKGAWYGWPDFIGNVPITEPRYQPERGKAPTFLLANHNELPSPESPLLCFPPHAAAVKFAIAPSSSPAWAGHLFVALFGDEAPMTAPANPRVGRSVVRIDPSDWSLHPVVQGELLRPIDVSFSPVENALYVLDFGNFEMLDNGAVKAAARSGKLWRCAL